MKKIKKLLKYLFLGEDFWILVFEIEGKKYKIYPPRFFGWADPFIVKYKNIYYVFFEAYSIFKGKGFLQVGELDINNKKVVNIKTILDKKYHLSYPNVFLCKGNFFMIPETHENNTIELYKASKFPYKWDFVKILVNNIDSVDTTVFSGNEKIYLFTNVKKDCKYNGDNLTIFQSQTLFSDFKKNYEKDSENSNLRNGGNIIYKNNRLYRVAQNCNNIYGKNIILYEILSKNFSKYQEILKGIVSFGE